jgi:hypothetical protein
MDSRRVQVNEALAVLSLQEVLNFSSIDFLDDRQNGSIFADIAGNPRISPNRIPLAAARVISIRRVALDLSSSTVSSAAFGSDSFLMFPGVTGSASTRCF